MFTRLLRFLFPQKKSVGKSTTKRTKPLPAASSTRAEAPSPSRVMAPAAPVRPAPEKAVATAESLERSLKWRSRVLADSWKKSESQGDGPELVAALQRGGPELIRRPPAAAQRALGVVRNPDSTLQDLAAIFEEDPTLAQSLLKTANSAWYQRGGTSIVSILQGVQRIGTQGVENVLVSNIVHGLLCRPGGRFEAMVNAVWSHMLRTATLARRLAPACRIDPETAYSLALLHDVGKLVTFDAVSGLRKQLRRDVKIPDEFLSLILAHLHEPIGGHAVLSWGLGGEAAHVVANHHRRPIPEGVDPMTELVFLAERLDLAEARERVFDWDAAWDEGKLTIDRAAVEELWLEEAA